MGDDSYFRLHTFIELLLDTGRVLLPFEETCLVLTCGSEFALPSTSGATSESLLESESIVELKWRDPETLRSNESRGWKATDPTESYQQL